MQLRKIPNWSESLNRTKNSNMYLQLHVRRHVAKHVPGVLFLVSFNTICDFDWTTGFYWELHALPLAARS